MISFLFIYLGTDEERGIRKWRDICENDNLYRHNIYDLPLIQIYFNKIRLFRYLPFCPSFRTTTNVDPDKHGGYAHVQSDNNATAKKYESGICLSNNFSNGTADDTNNTYL